jgi:penicillin amidase
LFQKWDFRETQESAAAALFEVWLSHHLKGAYRKAVLPAAAATEIVSTDMRVMVEDLEKPSRRFGGQAPTRRDALLLTTLSAAYKELESLQGPDSGQWQWGRLQYNLVEHAFSEAVEKSTQARINIGPFPKNGSEFTPNQSLYRPGDFRQSNGPSFRIVVDVGNWDGSWAVNYPGQSGDPASPHYRDLAPLWLEGKYFPLLYSRSAIEKETELRLRLVPPEPTGIK